MAKILLSKQPLTVAVIGATGDQGGATARALLRQGHHVRGLTRNPSSLKAKLLQQLGVETVRADLNDYDSLVSAFTGADAVFAITTSLEDDSDVSLEVTHGRALVDAAVAADVSHFVFSSAANADRSTGIPHFESKYQTEQYLRASGLRWTIIGPAAFMYDIRKTWQADEIKAGKFRQFMPADKPLQYIAIPDIGSFAAHAISNPNKFAGKRIDIASEELTGPELAEVLSRMYGHPITYDELPLEIADKYSADLAAMFRYYQNPGMDIDIANLRREYPEVHWHTYENWLKHNQ